MFDILHVFCNGSSTLLRTDKILSMDHDSSTGGRGICLLEGGPRSPRCGGVKVRVREYNSNLGREKRHQAELSSPKDTTLSNRRTQVNHTQIREI